MKKMMVLIVLVAGFWFMACETTSKSAVAAAPNETTMPKKVFSDSTKLARPSKASKANNGGQVPADRMSSPTPIKE